MISFCLSCRDSMGATVSALTAQNAGAGKGDRARQVLKDALTISVIYGCLITVLMWLVHRRFSLFCQDAAVVAAGTGYMPVIFLTRSLPASTFALAFFRCVWQELHRLCAQRAGSGAHSRARRVAAVERLLRHAVPHGHRLAVRVDSVGDYLRGGIYRTQPSRSF